MILIVTIATQKYVVDVGFSNMSPCRPLPMNPSAEVYTNAGSAEVRLYQQTMRRGSLPRWEYQIRFSPKSDWTTAYSFFDIEFGPADFEVMSYFTSCSPSSWFTTALVCVRMILDEETEEIVGDVTLFGTECKRRVKGQSELVRDCKTEKERVEVIESDFGIRLTEEEVAGIKGRSSELLVANESA